VAARVCVAIGEGLEGLVGRSGPSGGYLRAHIMPVLSQMGVFTGGMVVDANGGKRSTIVGVWEVCKVEESSRAGVARAWEEGEGVG
jgi:hypothetical protein